MVDVKLSVFPAMMRVAGRRVVVLGGGALALRKLRLVAKSEAMLTVISPHIDAVLRSALDTQAIVFDRSARLDDLRGAALVIVAEEDHDRAAVGACLARRAGAPVNVVDQPAMSDWTMPALVQRGPLVAAIATAGAAPVIARDVRARLEPLLPQNLGDLIAVAGRWRARVADTLSDERQRRRFWERALRGAAAERALAGDAAGADAAFAAELDDAATAASTASGVVHIVGAGPGDPELLTLKALRLLQDADIVFYDSLVSEGVLELIRRDAERIFVGKRRARHAVPQPAIHEQLIAAARAGQRVVRLKGGDPFVFGRGGEELEALHAAGVDAHVVPGVSSALAAAAAAGAPLTHRDHAQAVTFITGYGKAGATPDLDWRALARPGQTLVVFMGLTTADTIAKRLMAAGRDAATPTAVVENASLADERIVRAPLRDMAASVAEAGMTGPALLIIGEVAGARRDALAPLRALAAEAKALETAA